MFEVVSARDDKTISAPVLIPSPATISIDGRPNSNLLTELQWYLEHFLDYPFDPETDHAERIQRALELWGETAFRALFSDDTGYRLFDAQTQNDFSNLDLQIVSDDAGVMGWPWEALRDPDHGTLAHTCRIERQLTTVQPPPPLPSNLPHDCVNILMIVARPFENDVQYRSLARPLVQLIERENLPARVEILRPPTLDQLRDHLAQNPGYYHVIHFDMHGAYGPGTTAKAEGTLVFEDDNGEPNPVRAAQLSALLHEHAVPLVVLTACQSARIDASSSDPFSSVATALLGAGMRSVVAMAYSLYVSGAEQFLPAFYRRLFQTGSVAEAVRAGRQQMIAEPGRVCARGTFPLEDWLLPVLYKQNTVGFSFTGLTQHTPRESRLPPELQQLDSPYGFVGRDSVLLVLERAMRRPEAGIVIQAMGGTGKTTLVKGLLQWLDQTDGLGAGAIWLSFREIHSSEYVLNRLGDALIGGDFSAAPVETKIAALASVLSETPVLIVWDNFESALVNLPQPDQQHLADLLNRLNGGLTKIFITSRSTEDWLGRRLILQLEGLRTEEQWEFCNLIVRALKLDVDRNDENFIELMDLLDGHPLSMQIVLPRLAQMTAAEVLEALRKNIADLGLGSSEAEDRVWATFALIDKSVPDNLRPLLVPLSFFSRYAPFDLLAVLVKEVGYPATTSDLERLGAILVTSGVARPFSNSDLYKIHPLFTAHLRARVNSGKSIPATEVDKWATPFVDQVARSADQLWSKPFNQQQAPFEMMGLTFEYALELALRLQMNTHVTALFQALGTYAINSRNFKEAAQLYKRLAAFSDGLKNFSALSTAYYQLAILAQKTNNLDEAEDYHKKALALKEKIGIQERLAVSYYQLGTVLNAKGAHEEALNYLNRALDRATQEHNYDIQFSALTAIGGIAEAEYGDFDKASRFYLDALKICQTHGLAHHVADIYQRLGSLALRANHLQDAERYLFHALTAAKAERDSVSVAYVHRALAEVRAVAGDVNRARELYLKALATFEEIGDDGQAIYIYESLAQLALQTKDIGLAEKWLEKIRVKSEEEGLRAQLNVIQFALRYDPVLADRWSHEALATATRLKSAYQVSMAQQFIGIAAELSQDLPTAIKWYNEAIETRAGFGDELGVASARAQLAGPLFSQGKTLEATAALIAAMKVFQATGQVGLFNSSSEQFEFMMQDASPDEANQMRALWRTAGFPPSA